MYFIEKIYYKLTKLKLEMLIENIQKRNVQKPRLIFEKYYNFDIQETYHNNMK